MKYLRAVLSALSFWVQGSQHLPVAIRSTNTSTRMSGSWRLARKAESLSKHAPAPHGLVYDVCANEEDDMANRRAAAKKAARTRKIRAAGKKAARTRRLGAAGKKAALTKKRRAAAQKAAATRKLKKEQSTPVPPTATPSAPPQQPVPETQPEPGIETIQK